MTWERLEKLFVGEYADEGTAIEAMRCLMKLTHLKNETPPGLWVRTKKLVTLAFPEEVKSDAVMQA